MCMSTVKLEFEKRYYQWILQDWKRELRDDLPFLRSVNEQFIIRLIENIEKNQRWPFVSSLVKRFRRNLLSKLGENFTEEDRKNERLFLAACDIASFIEPQNYLEPKKLVKRSQLRSAITKAMVPMLGDNYEDLGDWREWRYRTRIGSWQVLTYIDIGGQGHQLCYHHDIIASENVYLAEGISLFSWLAVASQTNWRGLKESDVESATETLAKLVKHFLDIAPKLLEDLSVDS